MAGRRITGAAMVKGALRALIAATRGASRHPLRYGFGIYVGLAVAALISAWCWRALALPTAGPALFPIHFYQYVIGDLDGRSCPSFPVCSAYARQALATHGPLLGGWLILDRLIHEGGDLRRGPWVLVEGERRLYDPLQRNDAWLRPRMEE